MPRPHASRHLPLSLPLHRPAAMPLVDAASATGMDTLGALARELDGFSGLMLWLANEGGRIEFVTPSLLRWLGLSLDEYRAGAWLDRLHPALRERTERRLLHNLASRRPWRMEYELRGQDGSYRYLRNLARPVAPAGTAPGWVGVLLDDTARARHAENQRFIQVCTTSLRTAQTEQLAVGRAAELIVPALTDWCFIELRQPGGEALLCSHLRGLEVAHVTHARSQHLPVPDPPPSRRCLPPALPVDETLRTLLSSTGHHAPPGREIVELALRDGNEALGTLVMSIAGGPAVGTGLAVQVARQLAATIVAIRAANGQRHARARVVRTLRAAAHLAELQSALEHVTSPWQVAEHVTRMLVRDARALSVGVLWTLRPDFLVGLRAEDTGIFAKVSGPLGTAGAVREAMTTGTEVLLDSGEEHRRRFSEGSPFLGFLGGALVLPFKETHHALGCLTMEWSPQQDRTTALRIARDVATVAGRTLGKLLAPPPARLVVDATQQAQRVKPRESTTRADAPASPHALDVRLVEDILDALPQGLILCRAGKSEPTLVMANRSARQRSGIVSRTDEGTPMENVFTPRIATVWSRAYERLRLHGGQAWFTEGTTVHLVPIRLSDWEEYVLTVMEPDDVVVAAFQLPRLSGPGMGAVERLSARLAHHLHNLLTVVTGHGGQGFESPARESPGPGLKEVLRAAERAGLLVQQMLAFAHQQIVVPRPVNVRRVLDRLMDILQPLMHDDVRVILDVPPSLSHVRADPTQIEQLVLNLVLNANDAMAQGGVLTVRAADVMLRDPPPAHASLAAPPGPAVMIAVSDTGSGLGSDRVTPPSTGTGASDDPMSMGLGVAAVYSIARELRGGLVVYRTPGHGSVFKVFIPTSPRPVAEAARSPQVPRTVVLVVDDDAAVRQVAAMVLRADGYDVIEANTPGVALELLRQAPIDVLLTDVAMPGMDGLELARRALLTHPSLKVLLMSGHEDIAPSEVPHPPWPLIPKPFSPSVLRARLHHVAPHRGADVTPLHTPVPAAAHGGRHG